MAFGLADIFSSIGSAASNAGSGLASIFSGGGGNTASSIGSQIGSAAGGNQQQQNKGFWNVGLADLLEPAITGGVGALSSLSKLSAHEDELGLSRERLAQDRELAMLDAELARERIAQAAAAAAMQAGAANAATKQRANQALMQSILSGSSNEATALQNVAQLLQNAIRGPVRR